MTITVFFDTETTGLPIDRSMNIPRTKKDLWSYTSCRLVQLAWIVDDSGTIIDEQSHLVNPKGYLIPDSKFHPFTHVDCVSRGISIEEILMKFGKIVSNCDRLVAHNIMFDLNVLLAEGIRYDFPFVLNQKCMLSCSCSDLWKYTKLTNAYDSIPGDKVKYENHEALADSHVCRIIWNWKQKNMDEIDNYGNMRRLQYVRKDF